MKCFYHKSNLDGHCSGAIVKKKYPDVECIGVDYNDEIDWLSINPKEEIFVVDFSFPVDVMERLNEENDLIWIDHHKSAIEKMGDFIYAGKREIGRGACELTWEYLHPDEVMPLTVKLLSLYDVWMHEDERVLPFQYGFKTLLDTSPDSSVWEYYLRSGSLDGVYVLINTGNIILDYEKKQNRMYAEGMAYETEFEGHRCIVINKAYQNPKIFDSVFYPDKHDIMVLFGVKPGEVKYLLYSPDGGVDVSKIAAKHGGGGHANAAGFYSETILF